MIRSGKKYLVVGAGITGCVSALQLSAQGHDVMLYEASGSIGGILRDQEINQKKYFSGCQYFSVGEPWFNLLPQQLQSQLVEYEHTYGSISDFEGHRIASTSMAMPVFPSATFKPEEFSRTLDNSTLCSRFSFYNQTIDQNLCAWVKRFGIDPGTVSGDNATALQLPRVNYDGMDEALIELKKNPVLDSVLALPFKKRMPGQSIKAALPENGYDEFFDELEQWLTASRVNLKTNAPVKVKKNDQSLEFWSRSKKLENFTNVIWAANPNPLLKGLQYPILENFYAKSEVHYFDLKQPEIAIDPVYYQVFSDRTDINRLFLYSVSKQPRMTVECFAGNNSPETIAEEAKELLQEFGHGCKLSWQGSTKQKLYIFHSENDRQVLHDMLSAHKNTDCTVLDSGWLSFGRDAKIKRIMEQVS